MRALRLILGTLILPATAAAGSPASLQECAVIAADAARLACYDRIAGRDVPGPTSAPAVTVPAAPASAAPAAPAPAPPTLASAAVAAAPAPAAASVTAAAPAAAAAPAKQSFGLYPVEHPPPPPAAKSMTARVVEVGTSVGGHMTVGLEGGQLWELDDADPLLAVGDTVTITRATFGSFLLQTPTKRSHRVRRLR